MKHEKFKAKIFVGIAIYFSAGQSGIRAGKRCRGYSGSHTDGDELFRSGDEIDLCDRCCRGTYRRGEGVQQIQFG